MQKQKYRISEGAEIINGARVPDTRIVEMSECEAEYYVSLGIASLHKTSGRGRPKDDVGG